MQSKSKPRTAAELGFSLIVITTLFLAGCGGGGSSTPVSLNTTTPSGASTAVGSYIADQRGTNFVGWQNLATFAGVYTLSAGANAYNSNYSEKYFTGATWAASPISPSYDLTPAGWVLSPNTATLVDNGNGNTVTITQTGEPAVSMTVIKTSLAGTAIPDSACGGVACTVPGNYPAGAAQYSYSYASDLYNIFGTSGVTDVNGTVLTALPAIGSTFCDPNVFFVFVPITPTPAAGVNNYNAYSTFGCTGANIASATAGTVLFTGLIGIKATGNAVAPNVGFLTGVTGPYSIYNGYFYVMKGGSIWSGFMAQAGVTASNIDENKIAINAELVAQGVTPLP